MKIDTQKFHHHIMGGINAKGEKGEQGALDVGAHGYADLKGAERPAFALSTIADTARFLNLSQRQRPAEGRAF
ncbi:hypothetical protein ACFSHQ_22070 [Gemmobacter lanyuensis]